MWGQGVGQCMGSCMGSCTWDRGVGQYDTMLLKCLVIGRAEGPGVVHMRVSAKVRIGGVRGEGI